MNLTEKIITIKNNIAHNNTEEIYKEFSKLIFQIGERELEDQLILIQSMHMSLLEDKRLNIISFTDFQLSSNSIKYNLLDFLNYIEKRYFSDIEKDIDSYHESTFQRTRSLGNKAKLIYDIKGGQIIRQKAINSSFSIPNRDLNDPIWKEWIENRNYHFELRQERIWLGRHLEHQYGKLIIMPFKETDYKKESPKYAIIRLQLLYDFIQTNKEKLDIVSIPKKEYHRLHNLTIIGETFYAESKTRIDGGWGNTSISTKNVLSKIEEFDIEFYELLNEKGLDVFSSKEKSMSEIKEEIEKIRATIK